jgi:hypothetical protein
LGGRENKFEITKDKEEEVLHDHLKIECNASEGNVYLALPMNYSAAIQACSQIIQDQVRQKKIRLTLLRIKLKRRGQRFKT